MAYNSARQEDLESPVDCKEMMSQPRVMQLPKKPSLFFVLIEIEHFRRALVPHHSLLVRPHCAAFVIPGVRQLVTLVKRRVARIIGDLVNRVTQRQQKDLGSCVGV